MVKRGAVRMEPLYEIMFPILWKQNYDDGAFFKDRIVLVGATSEGSKDFLRTPFGRLAGPEPARHHPDFAQHLPICRVTW